MWSLSVHCVTAGCPRDTAPVGAFCLRLIWRQYCCPEAVRSGDDPHLPPKLQSDTKLNSLSKNTNTGGRNRYHPLSSDRVCHDQDVSHGLANRCCRLSRARRDVAEVSCFAADSSEESQTGEQWGVLARPLLHHSSPVHTLKGPCKSLAIRLRPLQPQEVVQAVYGQAAERREKNPATPPGSGVDMPTVSYTSLSL
ncbi:hypothetical protein DPEC_G00264780 [Dallia pectoralis]|uniref:Uncharacterized protein n=1 Tax=Dallia pectoralis TaxID=75939 RepID=A0ACC2FSN2_DALPE|nr:hypothetical protein DPEC_G00264780 [Dallia pectoralis]